MGLLDFIKGQLIEVISWEDDSRDTLVYQFPVHDQAIKMGAQLTVRESQVAIFLNEGKLADVFQPGRYELTTRNLPVLTALRSWKFGFDSPFKADIYFLNTRQFSNNKWGTPQPVMVSDPEFSLVPLRAFGTFTFHVKDAALFFREFAGTDKLVTTDELINHFRGMIISQFSSALKRSGKTLVEINAAANELGTVLMPLLQPDFEAIGLELIKFMVENVSLPEDIQNELTSQDLDIRKTRRGGAAENEVEMQRLMNEQMVQLNALKQKAEMSQNVGDMQKFLQFQAGLSMEKGAGQGDGGMGNMMQNMMNMSMGANMANQMMKNMPTDDAPQAEHSAKKTKDEIMSTLKELAELKTAGILTDEEFNEKKKELLAQL